MSYCCEPAYEPPYQPRDVQPRDAMIICSSSSGLLLLGRYRPLRLLGQGGFGRTFLAIDELPHAPVYCVIKQSLFPAQTANQERAAVRAWQNEAFRLAKLGDHSQIPALLNAFEQDGQTYLVQEFVDGQTLDQELAEVGAFAASQVRQILNQLLPVLQFIHDRRIIHRDIKPANIIRRSRDAQLVLVDFGAAKGVTEMTSAKTGTTIGSAEYAAPEQTRGKAVFASDLYSLGVTCIHLLTQVAPFDLFDSSENVWRWQDFLSHPVDASLVRVLNRMLQPATRQRYHSAAEVLEDLRVEPTQVTDGFPSAGTRSSFGMTRTSATQISATRISAMERSPLSATVYDPQTQAWYHIPDLREQSEFVWAVASFMRPRPLAVDSTFNPK